MGQIDDKGFTIKEDGTIVRNPNLDKLKGKLSGGNGNGNGNPGSGGKGKWGWLALLVIACVIVGGIIMNNYDNSDNYYPSDTESVGSEFSADTTDIEPSGVVEEEVESQDYEEGNVDDGEYIVDGIVYAYEEPSINDIDVWKDEYASNCSQLIEEMDYDYDIPEEMLEDHPCLVYLILVSRSLKDGDEKQNWFNMYKLMNDDQIYELYSILYREKYKLAKIEASMKKR